MSKYLGTIGLAARAGAIVYGETLINDIRGSKVSLVLVAKDAGPSNKKKIMDKCNSFNVRCIEISTKEELSIASGKMNVSAIGITNQKIAKKINENIKVGEFDGEEEE